MFSLVRAPVMISNWRPEVIIACLIGKVICFGESLSFDNIPQLWKYVKTRLPASALRYLLDDAALLHDI